MRKKIFWIVSNIKRKVYYINNLLCNDYNKLLFFNSFGDLNPDKYWAVVNIREDVGFFAFVLDALISIRLISNLNISPFILWKSKIYGKNQFNTFDDYFIRTENIEIAEIFKSENVLKIDFNFAYDFFKKYKTYYLIPEIILDELSVLYSKHFRLNENCITIIDEYKSKVENQNYVAVHIRRGDMVNSIKDHPKLAAIEEYIVETKKALLETKSNKIFLATDDTIAIASFVEAFGMDVIYFQDNKRSSDNTGIHFNNFGNDDSKYLGGIEVLRDAYTLSYCNSIVCGLSNVSMCARIIKKSNKSDFEYVKIIDKGLNESGVSSQRKTRINLKNIVK